MKVFAFCHFSMLLAVLCHGCTDHSVAIVEPVRALEEVVRFNPGANRDVDLLFVVDNSDSMEREQIALASKFQTMLDVLQDHPDGLPSLHIGVISTDLGSGEEKSCSATGDDARFLGTTCTSPEVPFLRTIALDDGSRETNFSGDLSQAFACRATLGVGGCGFEQPLEAMRKALQAPQANDFLRKDARLAVIIITDEDDCSVYEDEMLNAAIVDLDSTLGPPKSFRCFEFGVTCADENLRREGPHEDCKPKTDSKYMYDVQEYVAFLQTLKDSPSQVFVATIAGDSEPVIVSQRSRSGEPDFLALDFSCTETDDTQPVPQIITEAVPPIRLDAFVNAFGRNGKRTSICAKDLSPALKDIADVLVETLTPCLEGNLVDTQSEAPGVQPYCIASQNPGTDEERSVPLCDNTSNPEASQNLPCYAVELDPENCSDTPTQLSPVLYFPPGASIPPDLTISVACENTDPVIIGT